MHRPSSALLPPSEARERARALHDEIRDALRRTLDAVSRLRMREAGAFEEVYETARQVSEAVRRHNEVEASTLAPVLENIDAWGKERVRALGEGHRCVERACLCLLQLPDDIDGMIAAVEDLVCEVVRVLQAEEKELFHSNVLDDDPIVVDQTDG